MLCQALRSVGVVDSPGADAFWFSKDGGRWFSFRIGTLVRSVGFYSEKKKKLTDTGFCWFF